MPTTNATALLAILREGWADGQRARKLLPAARPSLTALVDECKRRYGDDEPARMAFMDGHCSGVEDDSYAMDIAKANIMEDYATPPRT